MAPLAIEQDVVWAAGRGASVVSHETALTGSEPTLEEHFFVRMRPLVERALKENRRDAWPLWVLHLDFKTNEREHHEAIWALLGKYEPWLTTAPRVAGDTAPEPFRIGPVIVLTENGDGQAAVFHDRVPAGSSLRIFGTVPSAVVLPSGDRAAQLEAMFAAPPEAHIPSGATNYRRWTNFSWAAVERGGQAAAADWTSADDTRLRALVDRAHSLGLWVRFYTLNGHPADLDRGWSASYNFGSVGAVTPRWRAAIAAGADFIATDQYEEFAALLSEREHAAPGSYNESVVVQGERFREQERGVPSQLTIGPAEILSLRNLLTNDPMRAIQILPGVATGDDFRSEFSVRGSAFDHMSYTFDGIPTSFLLHTVQQVRDGGSIAMLNGDILSSVTLLNGSYPQRYGNRLGAELSFSMREGARDRTRTRITISGTDSSFVAEGPVGPTKAGSWIVSARKSYLDFLLRQITDEEEFGFSFADAQAKFAYDLSPEDRLEISAVAGSSTLDQTGLSTGLNFLTIGRNRAQMLIGSWRKTTPRGLIVTNRLAYAGNHYTNTNPNGEEIGEGGGTDLTWRADATLARGGLTYEAGAQLQSQARHDVHRRLLSRNRQQLRQSFDQRAVWSSAYAQTRWTPGPWALTAGTRVDHWTHTGGLTGSPWVSAERRLGHRVTARAAASLQRQVPGLEQTTGLRARPDFPVGEERAFGIDAGLEQTIGSTLRWQVTLYNREERDRYTLLNFEDRLVDGIAMFGGLSGPWATALDGYARGVELLVQRRSPAGLTGWFSYSLGFNRYRDRLTNEAFDGDFDQRHTVNAYASYHVSPRMSVAARLRSGTNFPAPGYWEERADGYYLAGRRNQLRVPAYTRLDVRGTRSFQWRPARLTLFVELINALDRENARFITPDVLLPSLRVTEMFESMLPRLPSAGLMIEF